MGGLGARWQLQWLTPGRTVCLEVGADIYRLRKTGYNSRNGLVKGKVSRVSSRVRYVYM